MSLTLTVENEASLPDGGPLTIAVGDRRRVEIGRDAGLDWTLPDPSRTISGRHCEIDFRDGGYWLHDVSRNGTFVNRSDRRIQEPYRLSDGDRIEVGRYIIAVRLGPAAEGAGPAPPSASASPDDYWAAAGDAAPAIDRKELRPARELRPVQPDFADWAVDVPPPAETPRAPGSAPAGEGYDWAASTPPPPPPAPPPVPSPRRRSAAHAPEGWDAAPAVPPPDAPLPPPAPEQAAPPPAAADNPWRASSRVTLPEPEPPAPDVPPPGRPAFAPPAAPPEPMPRPVPRSSDGPDFVARLAKGAGIPTETLSWRDPGDLAEELGALLRLASENMKQLLAARAETKRAARTSNQTMIQALDNNPLKFSPTTDDAMRTMFGRPTSGFLDGRRAFEAGFRDLKGHQVKTYAAMQNALRLLLQDLDPDAIDEASGADTGLRALVSSRKAKLWDVYVARWDTLNAPHENGMVDAFMVFFSECYDWGDRSK